MLEIAFVRRRLQKRMPLRISRGTSSGSENLFATVSGDGHTGVGECAPGVLMDELLAESAQRQLEAALQGVELRQGPHAVFAALASRGVDPAASAAVDCALWDWLAKRAGLPLHRLLGLPRCEVPTSVTVGIGPPDEVASRTAEVLGRTGARHLKLKLGSPEGFEADQAAYLAAQQAAAPMGASLRVDANGGWTPTVAKAMTGWLAERGCDYVEQPLAQGEEAALPEVFASRRLPVFLDESVRSSRDVPPLADRCDGVNLKLMKTGGITEALRLVATARACGLMTMVGCMGESSVAIASATAIGALFDYVDLDSHLNLVDDPGLGLVFEDGVVRAPEVPGHGASLRPEAGP